MDRYNPRIIASLLNLEECSCTADDYADCSSRGDIYACGYLNNGPRADAHPAADLGRTPHPVDADADDRERPRMMPCAHDWHPAGAYPELDEWRCVKCGAGRVGKP